MDEVQQHDGGTRADSTSRPQADLTRRPRARLFVFLAWFLALMLIGAGAYFGVRYYRYRNGYLLPMERYNAYMDIFRNDTYGGATPEETLKLFVAALRAGDVEKASLYFVPDDRGSREKWRDALAKDRDKGNLSELAELFDQAKF
ncbi:MAG: hypothetical protein HYV25_01920, partial [Candidatus Harrisonbacteria bacterium]|nr:hypothetical protein [Candidatus Harrisonbacteria bacterium]